MRRVPAAGLVGVAFLSAVHGLPPASAARAPIAPEARAPTALEARAPTALEARAPTALEAPSATASGAAAPSGGDTAERRMAITVDDLPLSHAGRHTAAQEATITRRLLATLVDHGVPAIGFVNESKLERGGTSADGGAGAGTGADAETGLAGGAPERAGGRIPGDALDSARVRLLERWLDAGLSLGNHGYAHLDLHRVDPERWMADILRGERVIRPLVEARGGELRWFRHPYLHVGRSARVQDRTYRFLGEHGYRVAPVTIDNGEYIYAAAFADAWNRGDEAVMERLGTDYVRYMSEVVAFYEDQARRIVGGPIPQVLLIHANALNAFWLDPLLDRLQARGYGWISLDQAVRHPAYRRPIDGYTGPGGITWLHRWAITEGLDRAIFRGEPEVPGWVRALAEGGTSG